MLHTRPREVESAGHWRRFFNFIIDSQFVLILVTVQLYLLEFIPQFKLQKEMILIIFLFFWLIASFVYYVPLEYYYQRSIGKFVTSTVVIDKFGDKPTLNQIFIRTFLRSITLIFDYLYFWDYLNSTSFCRGFHDRNSETWVVPLTEKRELKQLLEEQG